MRPVPRIQRRTVPQARRNRAHSPRGRPHPSVAQLLHATRMSMCAMRRAGAGRETRLPCPTQIRGRAQRAVRFGVRAPAQAGGPAVLAPHSDKVAHPSRTCYSGHGCRCAPCTELNRQATAARRLVNPDRRWARTFTHTERSTHPSLTCYQLHRCRCALCKELGRIENVAARARRRALPPKPAPLPDWELAVLRRAVGILP